MPTFADRTRVQSGFMNQQALANDAPLFQMQLSGHA